MSNLLDRASILLTPTAYDNGSMLSIKPKNGDGDFTFSRAGNASRVNSSGNIVTESANIPRIDYTDGCGVWLREKQSTNLINYSSDFSQLNLASGASIDINQIISPDGTQNATKLNTTGASSRVQQSLILSGINTISIFVKYAGDDVTVRFERNTANDRCTFDISSSGVVFNSAESGITSYDIKEFSNDWYRISCSYDGGSYFQFNGDITGGGGSVYIWGAQAESQSQATSYIPTSGATSTRLQDIATIDLSGFSLTSITETINGVDQTPITIIPSTYTIPCGRINKIIMI